MIIFYIITRDTIQSAVNRETSILSVRRKDESGETLFDQLVMDEEYEVMLKQYMDEARAEIMLNIAAHYLLGTPTELEPVYREFANFNQDRDFSLFLNMHDDWPNNYHKAVDVKLQQYITDYVCYRWFETKSPADAATYYSRLEKTITDIQRLLVRKHVPLTRYPSFP